MSGRSPKQIAKTLNRQGVAGPFGGNWSPQWTTDTKPAFVRGGAILADRLVIATDGDTRLYLVDPDPAGSKPLASAEILEVGYN